VIRDRSYRLFTTAMILFGVAAVVLSSVGLYMIFFDSADEGPELVELGEYACEEFDGDPTVAHEPDYEIERTLRGTSLIDSINATDTGGGVRLEINVTGQILDASARRADGTNVTVVQPDDGPDIVIETDEAVPFRLWIDSVDDATVTRTQLEVCPPA